MKIDEAESKRVGITVMRTEKKAENKESHSVETSSRKSKKTNEDDEFISRGREE